MSTNSRFHDSPERWRDYLLLQARNAIGPNLRSKINESDLAHEVLLAVYQQKDRFVGSTSGEWVAWLNKILAGTLIDQLRYHHAEKRNVDREISMDAVLEESSVKLGNLIQSTDVSPEHNALRHEQLARLATIVNQLPQPQREAIELRYLCEQSIQEICDLMNRSSGSIAGLLRRGLREIRRAFLEASDG